MNTIETIETSNYAVFDTIQDKRKKGAQVQAIKYIKRLASVSNTDISDWDITGIFGEDGLIATDRNKINQLFFTYKDSSKKVKTPLHHSTVAAIHKLQEMRQFGDLKFIESQLKQEEKYMNDHYRAFQNNLANVNRARKQIDLMKGYKPNYPAEVAEIVTEGFWKYVEIDTTVGEITFETVNPIVLKDYNPKQGVKYSLDMGKFRLKVKVSENRLKCFPWPENFAYKMDNHPHPHVDRGGNICFGDLKVESQMALAGGNMKQIMDLVQRTITSFDGGSPFVQLATLKKVREDYVRMYGTEQEKAQMVEEAQGTREEGVPSNEQAGANRVSQGPQPAQVRGEERDTDIEF